MLITGENCSREKDTLYLQEDGAYKKYCTNVN